MGVYLRIGIELHNVDPNNALPFTHFGTFAKLQELLIEKGFIFIFLGSSSHKIKKKAEQVACEKALQTFDQ